MSENLLPDNLAHLLQQQFQLKPDSCYASRFRFNWQHGKLCLNDAQNPQFKSFCVDLEQNDKSLSNQHANPHRSPLAKAVGAKNGLRVLDLTAGWGQDAYRLATLGCHVTLCECQPLVAALLWDGLRRLQLTDTRVAAHLHLYFGDSFKQLTTETQQQFDVIYFDPMYQAESLKGQVKKDLQLLRALASADQPICDENTLFLAAMATGCKRVVVKRAKTGAVLAGREPHHQIIGKSLRFDVYC